MARMFDGEDVLWCEDVRWRWLSMARVFDGGEDVSLRGCSMEMMLYGEDVRWRGCSMARMFDGSDI